MTNALVKPPTIQLNAVQPSKIQSPTLRDDTLARDRLLDWLSVKIHHQVVLLVAEAGYGKTTLLADFTRRTRMRVLWYRLDPEDRDWVAFLRHLVAAGQEHLPDFAPATRSLLAEISVGPTGPGPQVIGGAFLRDLAAFASEGTVLILDDVHLVDDIPEIKRLLRDLAARSPERFSVVMASRRQPAVPLSRLRSQGEVAELTTDDLRFSTDETIRLFREAYGQPLDDDVLLDVARRTDGWAASLALVQTAIRDRSPTEIRAFVRDLSGAAGDIHDYLAEEVLSDLNPDLQTFLMRTALLQSIDLELAAVAADVPVETARELIGSAELTGLLHRRGRAGRRFHPLVREFLERRLHEEVGLAEVKAIHVAIARAATADWRIAAHHYASAGASREVRAVIRDALPTIAGTGEYTLASSYLEGDRGSEDPSWAIIGSRTEYWRGRVAEALAIAEEALLIAPGSDLAGVNLASLLLSAGYVERALSVARDRLRGDPPASISEILHGIEAVAAASVDGDIRSIYAQFCRLADVHASDGLLHFAGISALNASYSAIPLGRVADVRDLALRSIELLSESSAGPELVSPKIQYAWALAASGDLRESRVVQDECVASHVSFARLEALRECATAEIWFGSATRAADLLARAAAMDLRDPEEERLRALVLADLALRMYDPQQAIAHLSTDDPNSPTVESGHKARWLALRARSAYLADALDVESTLQLAKAHAARQHAGLWVAYVAAIEALRTQEWSALGAVLAEQPLVINMLAEHFVQELHRLPPAVQSLVHANALMVSDRWVPTLRGALKDAGLGSQRAADLIAGVGSIDDVPALRDWVKKHRRVRHDRDPARTLARRVAAVAQVEDLGRVSIRMGDRYIDGAGIRRKVLALLCYLITRPQMAATRDQIVEAIWPDLDPDTANNSLHQTVYFLRRVFEPAYREDLSPGYIHHSSEVLWLDAELVVPASALCIRLLSQLAEPPDTNDVLRICETYVDQFALEFSYEPWAESYRDGLHAAYLHLVEEEIGRSIEAGRFSFGVNLARRALSLESESESLELSLIRLYRVSGAHAAAAEQYAHYSQMARETYGVEPVPLEVL